jgi:pyruvate carboxylase
MVISKVLVANRGEIAIRAFRAAYELGIGTVAVYAYEDRNSQHRLKADESYQIGDVGHPVRAYLSVHEIVETVPGPGLTPSIPVTAFCPKTRNWPRRARRPASGSSARASKCSS